MKRTKKLLSIFLSLCMLFSVTAGLDFSAYAMSSSGKCGDNVTYTFNSSTGELVISGTGAMTNTSPFSSNSNIKNVTINSGVTSIGNYAFRSCTGLTSVTISDSVTSIGYNAFGHCRGLTSVTIPDSVANIDNYAFYNCGGIKELIMPVSAKIYNNSSTFGNCYKIEKVTLTKGTGIMQNYSDFSGDSDTYFGFTPWYISRDNIKKLVIENGVENIGNYAFYGCTGLISVTIPDSVTSISDWAFRDCIGLKSVTIGKGVNSIGELAFCNCISLKNVTIPNSVTIIGDYAFDDIDDKPYVFYSSSKSDWNKIKIGVGNYPLSNAYMHFNNTKHEIVYIKTKATLSKNGVIQNSCKACGEISGSTTIYYPKTITLSATKYTYDGKAKKPTVTVKDSDGKTISSSNYTVAYSNNTNVGKATAKITFKGNYSGTVTKTFVINPKGTTISSLTAASKGFTAKWKKQATQTIGYQIRYSTKSSMASAKTVTVSSTSIVSKKITGLTAKKKYFVQIRTYKTVGKTKYYSSWSATKSVTTK